MNILIENLVSENSISLLSIWKVNIEILKDYIKYLDDTVDILLYSNIELYILASKLSILYLNQIESEIVNNTFFEILLLDINSYLECIKKLEDIIESYNYCKRNDKQNLNIIDPILETEIYSIDNIIKIDGICYDKHKYVELVSVLENNNIPNAEDYAKKIETNVSKSKTDDNTISTFENVKSIITSVLKPFNLKKSIIYSLLGILLFSTTSVSGMRQTGSINDEDEFVPYNDFISEDTHRIRTTGSFINEEFVPYEDSIPKDTHRIRTTGYIDEEDKFVPYNDFISEDTHRIRTTGSFIDDEFVPYEYFTPNDIYGIRKTGYFGEDEFISTDNDFFVKPLLRELKLKNEYAKIEGIYSIADLGLLDKELLYLKPNINKISKIYEAFIRRYKEDTLIAIEKALLDYSDLKENIKIDSSIYSKSINMVHYSSLSENSKSILYKTFEKIKEWNNNNKYEEIALILKYEKMIKNYF